MTRRVSISHGTHTDSGKGSPPVRLLPQQVGAAGLHLTLSLLRQQMGHWALTSFAQGSSSAESKLLQPGARGGAGRCRSCRSWCESPKLCGKGSSGGGARAGGREKRGVTQHPGGRLASVYTHTHTHTHTQKLHLHADMCKQTCTHSHRHALTDMHTHSHTCTQRYTNTPIH